MQRRILGRTNIEVSALGFGCVQLTSYREKKEAIATLEHAFAAGITHFDVARVYGFGRAEGILAEFLGDKRSHVTVATKFGFELPSGLVGNPRFISIAKKILTPFPGLLRRAKHRGSSMVKGGVFNANIAVKSLETSLRELKTDYIDVFLLHEATLSDISNEVLIEVLQQQLRKGTIRCFGIASDFEKLPADASLIPSGYNILQFNDNVVTRNLQKLSYYQERGVVTHSIFKYSSMLLKKIEEHPKIAQRFSLQIGIDLCDPEVINILSLHYALRSNVRGVVLFSSMNPIHITTNVQKSEISRFDETQLLGFIEFVDEMMKARLVSSVSSLTEETIL